MRARAGWWLVVGGVAVLVVAAAPVARAADPEKGKAVFEQCAACHSLDGTGDYDGPSLKGIMGRKAGSLEDYRYSAAMKRSDVTWDAMTLDKYVADPQAFIPGNRMAFAGISDKAERDDLIAYLAIATKN
ncbi:MAG TPA: cytochrome c family protein [Vicinamibacterales bacterium]|jgi:cytochrome c